jgi:hypothetical protein
MLHGVVPILALLGIWAYALLTTLYERFYGALGIPPSAVGLSYTSTLARSTGVVSFIIAAGTIAIAGGTIFHVVRRCISKRYWRPSLIRAEFDAYLLSLVSPHSRSRLILFYLR